MRLFITSYQKSGTHQIMPAFGILDDIVDRSYVDFTTIPDKWNGRQKEINYRNVREETIQEMKKPWNKRFGHIPYLPEYVEYIQCIPTKVLFNTRDPRDVVIACYYSILKTYNKGKYPGAKGFGHLNMADKDGTLLIHTDDPFSELIRIEAERWKHWVGWLQHDFVMQVKYEDLRTNPDETIEKIAEFVAPYPVDVPTVVGNLKPKSTNPTFRAGRIGDWKIEFNDKQKKLANKLFAETIVQLGYEI